MSDLDPRDEEGGGDLLAAELALGVLGGRERAEALRRRERDAPFATEVEAWEARLGPLAEEVAPAAPSRDLWPLIEARIAAHREPPRLVFAADRATPASRGALWSYAAAGAIAASLVWIAVLAGLRGAERPQPVLVASLAPTAGARPYWVATLDRSRGAVRIIPAQGGPVDPRTRELWLVPAGGKPRAVGLFAPDRASSLTLGRRLLASAGPKAALAVSLEPAGGSPTGAPTGPVIASGSLTSL